MQQPLAATGYCSADDNGRGHGANEGRIINLYC